MGSRIFEETDFMRRLTLIAGWALAGLALGGSAAAQIELVPIALAYSPREGQAEIEIEPWSEGGPSLGGTSAGRVDYFTVEPATIELEVGASFELADLEITAHGLSGNPVWHAPLQVELEAPPELLSLADALESQRLLAIQPGIGRLWLESVLPRGTGTGERYRLPVVIIVRAIDRRIP
jgi:hypothetical protein